MWFYSTRDKNNRVRSSQAILQGLSEEGGLFVPESLSHVLPSSRTSRMNQGGSWAMGSEIK